MVIMKIFHAMVKMNVSQATYIILFYYTTNNIYRHDDFSISTEFAREAHVQKNGTVFHGVTHKSSHGLIGRYTEKVIGLTKAAV
jgi:hypothetical protein